MEGSRNKKEVLRYHVTLQMKQLLMTFQNQIQKVLTYIHGLPDDTWKEPDPEDPLSLVDQVSFANLLS